MLGGVRITPYWAEKRGSDLANCHEQITPNPHGSMTPSYTTPAVRMRALAAMAALVAFAACDDSTGPAGGSNIAKVEVSVLPIGTATTNLPRGITVQLLGAPSNAANNFVDVPVTWSSSDDTRATVDQNGLVTTVGGGDVTISASAGGQTGTFDLNVQFPVGTVTVGAPPSSIRQEGTVELSATLVGSDGEPAVGRVVTWSSSDEDIATVDDGVVSGVADGTVTITATSEGVSGSTQVTVSGSPLVASVVVTPDDPFRGVGQTVQFTHTAKAASGSTVAGTTATWESSNTDVATVTATGLVTVVGVGTVNISATVDNGIGTDVKGSSELQGAVQLLNGVQQTVPTTTAGDDYFYAFVAPSGLASFTINTSGGTGDGDIYIFAPGATSVSCQSFNSGNTENCTITAPTAGTWRIQVNAWEGAPPNTSGMNITLTHP